ncbi:MAG TPA: DUF262 domain-containing HNH endonuclease family protein [Chthoniobacterales bacterium]
MKPYSRSIFDLFDGKRRYEVPLFQRQYVWKLEGHWEPLWEDIERKFAQRLSGSPSTPHFLGAMVLDQRRVYGNAVPVQLVIDGQQRLTTFQIFLSAFRDVCAAEGQQAYAEECARYLQNTGIMDNESVERYKLCPTNLDRKQFTDVIDSASKDEINKRHPRVRRKYQRRDDPRPKMIECYFFFYEQLLAFMKTEDHKQELPERVAIMHEALRGALQVVTVELEGDDDPQVIFETLNARGEPLLPSDLLRNFIFLRAAQKNESQQDLYDEFWLPFDDEFWRTLEKQGRLLRPRSDIFLQHYLTLHRRQEILISHLYSEYKDWIKGANPFPTVKEELANLGKYRTCFRELIQPDPNTPIGRFSAFLKIFDLSTVYPLVLGMMGAELVEEELGGMLEDLESYILRRAVCELGTKNYNRFFLAVLSKLAKSSFSRQNLRAALVEQKGDSVVWPDDARFKQAWLSKPAYHSVGPGRVQYALREIERRLHQPRAERIEILSALTVEHVLPGEWIGQWPFANGNRGVTWFEQFDKSRSDDDVEATAKRDRAKNTFGNLTLLTQPLNSSVSNSAFLIKKPEILKNSALALNRYFQDKEAWDESSIAARGEALFTHAVAKWAYPGQA